MGDTGAIAQLFEVQRPAITRHIGNIYKSGELDEKVVCSILEHTTQHGAMSGKTQSRNVKVYNLDMILSIGYRVNSKKATEFRKWANGVLKQYISKGYAINEQRLTDLKLVFQILERSEIPELSGTINLVSEYIQALFLLDSYDRKSLPGFGDTEYYPNVEKKASKIIIRSLVSFSWSHSRSLMSGKI